MQHIFSNCIVLYNLIITFQKGLKNCFDEAIVFALEEEAPKKKFKCLIL